MSDNCDICVKFFTYNMDVPFFEHGLALIIFYQYVIVLWEGSMHATINSSWPKETLLLRPGTWIQVERTWDLVRDSGQRKLTYSSQNHCTSSRSVYLSRRLYSHWERLVITHHLQKWESSPTKIKPVKWIRLQILYAACSSLRIPYSLI